MKFLNIKKIKNIAYVSFTREKSLNALNSGTLRELIDLNFQIKKDTKIKVVVFRSEGNNFSAGADIKEKTKKLSNLKIWKTNLGREARVALTRHMKR